MITGYFTEVDLPRVPPLDAVLRTLGIKPSLLVREATRIAPELRVRAISRPHLARLRRGRMDATSEKILVITAALQGLTGLRIRASDLFFLEPAAPPPVDVHASRVGLFSRWTSRMPSDNLSLSPSERLDRLYVEHSALLRAIAAESGIPRDDAESLVNDIFASFLERQPKVDDERAFLIGAVRNAAKHYRRKRRNESPLLPEHEQAQDLTTSNDIERWTLRLAVAQMLSRLGGKCREALRRKYVRDESYDEIAQGLGLSPTYVSEFLAACKRRALSIYRRITKSSS